MSAIAPDLVTRLEAIVDDVMREQRVPGCAVGVVIAGRTEYLRGFGVTDVDAPAPVDDDTVFRAASISKTFTATALVKLADAGRVDLDAPLAASLPSFSMRDPRHRAITPAQVLAHVAGLPDFDPLGVADEPPDDAPGAPGRFVASIRDLDLLGAPGERYAYSNLGFDLLVALIERVTGEDFEEHLRREVLAPAGLEASTFARRPPDPARIAAGHGLSRAGDVVALRRDLDHRRHLGCGTLTTTARDLCRWVEEQLAGAPHLLSRAAHERMLAPSPITARPDGTRAGLGFQIRPFRGHDFAGHGGWDPGFRAGMNFSRALGVGIVVLHAFHWAATLEVSNAALAVALGEVPDPVFRGDVGELGGPHELDGREVRIEIREGVPWLLDDGEARRMIRVPPNGLLVSSPEGREGIRVDANGARAFRVC